MKLRKGYYYVYPLAGSSGGDPVLFMEPVTKLDRSVEASVLGNCVLEALHLSYHDAPWPTDWKHVAEPLYRAAGVKSERAFMKESISVRVDLNANVVTIIPTTSKEFSNAGSPLLDKQLTFNLGNARDLGLAVTRALALSD